MAGKRKFSLVNLVLAAGALGFFLGLLVWSFAFLNVAAALHSIPGSATPAPSVAACQGPAGRSDLAGAETVSAEDGCEDAGAEQVSGGPR